MLITTPGFRRFDAINPEHLPRAVRMAVGRNCVPNKGRAIFLLVLEFGHTLTGPLPFAFLALLARVFR